VKAILNVCVEIFNMSLLGRFNNFYYWRNFTVRVLATLWIIYNNYNSSN